MVILNKQHLITNDQINKVISLLGDEYFPRKIVVFENRSECFLYNIRNCFKFEELSFMTLHWEVFALYDNLYVPFTDTVKLYTYVHKGNKLDRQLNILYSLVEALRNRHYNKDYFKKDDVKLTDIFALEDVNRALERVTGEYKGLMVKFVDNFMENNSKEISQIMNWDDEWVLNK